MGRPRGQTQRGERAVPASVLTVHESRAVLGDKERSVLPIALGEMMESFRSALANTAATSQLRLLGTWNVAIVTN